MHVIMLVNNRVVNGEVFRISDLCFHDALAARKGVSHRLCSVSFCLDSVAILEQRCKVCDT